MTRAPWIEASALLAASGLRVEPAPQPQSPWTRLMTQTIDYAFLARIDAVSRPIVFTSLGGLAAYIERKRFGQAIQLSEVEDIHARRDMAVGDCGPAPQGLRDRGVQIHTLLLDGGVDRSMGFAWLRGGGREDLQSALQRTATAQGEDRRRLMHAA